MKLCGQTEREEGVGLARRGLCLGSCVGVITWSISVSDEKLGIYVYTHTPSSFFPVWRECQSVMSPRPFWDEKARKWSKQMLEMIIT